ncbi:ABC transporter substrate-binding protein [Myxococcus sp. CA051A]|uniref:ABC transporter substrate-binding protein n=1 Tax=Myxococcus llanfairpwllgwyngyllgogerychwyrndrobwllllantysiliogogogochensis TaxID=2590453 RepID=A0A540WTN6_9BACT|nr:MULTISPECIES: ABC transporter substrate-binding protein [Myxococcus]NTX06719.1 ABC transporter substrate-binding protein [Myxococcus sp. CA040A]NTX36774.1 ABC transporter substrate-binding protein [Myxococcus sp. CA033]NTX57492.1 ABC transporter substrate-binding protein [Myxococcus sp. CA039A]NTX62586.1 ABC transporter substrate-binding protein [Myxococcus sp. CA051A]TQF12385.1 ABC transporter substrate-binding protein [Myxococcus llanfairpwllgwyngyllgogerychwyrndrobwllllantysiliogogogoche
MIASLLAATLIAAAPGPLSVVKSGNADVQKAANAPGATVESLASVVEKFVDFQELAKRALGDKTWATLTPAQRKDFSETMTGLLRASYAQKAIGQAQAEVKYGKESIEGTEATVNTTLTLKKDQIPVDYRLYKPSAKSDWRIYDVVTDEVSLVDTYKGQFQKLLSTKGFDGLLSTLKTKRAQLEKENAANSAKGSTGATGSATGGSAGPTK